MRSIVISALSLLCLTLWTPVPLTAQERDRSNISDQFKWDVTDVYPTEGKRSGGYSNGWAYDVHPYIDVRLSMLGNYLDIFATKIFRATLLSEFEFRIHEMAERGEQLTGDTLNILYLEIARKYYGHADEPAPGQDYWGRKVLGLQGSHGASLPVGWAAPGRVHLFMRAEPASERARPISVPTPPG